MIRFVLDAAFLVACVALSIVVIDFILRFGIDTATPHDHARGEEWTG